MKLLFNSQNIQKLHDSSNCNRLGKHGLELGIWLRRRSNSGRNITFIGSNPKEMTTVTRICPVWRLKTKVPFNKTMEGFLLQVNSRYTFGCPTPPQKKKSDHLSRAVEDLFSLKEFPIRIYNFLGLSRSC